MAKITIEIEIDHKPEATRYNGTVTVDDLTEEEIDFHLDEGALETALNTALNKIHPCMKITNTYRDL